MARKEKILTASAFRANCLPILDHLGPEGITVTKRGKPVARVLPIDFVDNSKLIGSMKRKVLVRGNISSTGVRWNAESRRAYPGVADEFAAAVGEDRGTAGERCTVLLTPAGREPSEAAALRGDGAADRGVAGSSRVERKVCAAQKPIQSLREAAVSEKAVRNARLACFQDPWKTSGSRCDNPRTKK